MTGNFEVNQAAGKISVCGWCLPGKTLFLLHPELRELGLPLSHTICEPCRDHFLQNINNQDNKPTEVKPK